MGGVVNRNTIGSWLKGSTLPGHREDVIKLGITAGYNVTEMKAGLTFACMNLKKLAKILEKRGWNTAGFLTFLRKIKKELIISEKWCWA